MIRGMTVSIVVDYKQVVEEEKELDDVRSVLSIMWNMIVLNVINLKIWF